MTILQITSLLIVLAGAFGAINYLFLKLPSTIGILLVSLMASLSLMALDFVFPAMDVSHQVRLLVASLDFSDTLLEGMLGLLLFAGALHVKIGDLRAQWVVVFLMATMGIALSTLVVGVGFSWLTGVPIMVIMPPRIVAKESGGLRIAHFPYGPGGRAGCAARGQPAKIPRNQNCG